MNLRRSESNSPECWSCTAYKSFLPQARGRQSGGEKRPLKAVQGRLNGANPPEKAGKMQHFFGDYSENLYFSPSETGVIMGRNGSPEDTFMRVQKALDPAPTGIRTTCPQSWQGVPRCCACGRGHNAVPASRIRGSASAGHPRQRVKAALRQSL